MDFALPEIGEGVYEAELVRWLVQPGDSVKRGQSLVEVLTDKATMEVPAPFAGKITSVVGEPGARLKVGQVILSFQDGRAEAPATAAQKPAVAAVERTVTTVPRTNGSSGGAIPVAAPSVRHLA